MGSEAPPSACPHNHQGVQKALPRFRVDADKFGGFQNPITVKIFNCKTNQFLRAVISSFLVNVANTGNS